LVDYAGALINDLAAGAEITPKRLSPVSLSYDLNRPAGDAGVVVELMDLAEVRHDGVSVGQHASAR